MPVSRTYTRRRSNQLEIKHDTTPCLVLSLIRLLVWECHGNYELREHTSCVKQRDRVIDQIRRDSLFEKNVRTCIPFPALRCFGCGSRVRLPSEHLVFPKHFLHTHTHSQSCFCQGAGSALWCVRPTHLQLVPNHVFFLSFFQENLIGAFTSLSSGVQNVLFRSLQLVSSLRYNPKKFTAFQ